jgi:hypothetical protein
MRWQRKAQIQRLIARLPRAFGDELYWTLQRRFGEYRRMDPGEHLLSTARILAAARTWGPVIDGADVLEVGTGRRLTIALGLWLAGAASVTTVDLHAQLKDELLGADLDFFRDHRAVVVNLLGSYADPAQLDARLGRLLALTRPGSRWPISRSTFTSRGACWNTSRSGR